MRGGRGPASQRAVQQQLAAQPVGRSGTVTITVTVGGGIVRVEATDRSGPGVPELRASGREAEGGRGLLLVEGLAAQWGWQRLGEQTVTWFELRHG